MRAGDAGEARPGDLVEAADCSWGGTIVTIDPAMGAVVVKVDDPRFSGQKLDAVLPFWIHEVELLMRGDA